MTVTLTQLVDDTISVFEQDTPNGLGISVILGNPFVGRQQPTLPIAAITFQNSGYGQEQVGRVGRTPRHGQTCTLLLYIFATNEGELIDLIERLHVMKDTIATVISNAVKVTMRYGETARVDVDLEETQLQHVVITELRLTWY